MGAGKKKYDTDPVHAIRLGHDLVWYFWDETWSNRHGPFKTKRLARTALKAYCNLYLSDLRGA